MKNEQALYEQIIHLRDRCYRMSRAHGITKLKAKTFSYWLSVPVLLLTIASGTLAYSGLFATLNQISIFLIGTISVLAAALTSLQLFFSFEGKVQKHSGAEARYKLMYRKLNLLSISAQEDEDGRLNIIKQVEEYINELGELDKISPDVSDRTYDAAKKDHLEDIEGI